MPYIGIIAWIIFIGVATMGNWFFLVMGGCLLTGAIIGAIMAFFTDTTGKRGKSNDDDKTEDRKPDFRYMR